MNLILLLVIIIVVLGLVGGGWGYHSGYYGYGGVGGIGVDLDQFVSHCGELPFFCFDPTCDYAAGKSNGLIFCASEGCQ